MRASPLLLGGRQRDEMQHPLTGATCVALPSVGMCPQLSCALTFMYLQQVRRAASLRGCCQGSWTGSPLAGLSFGTLEGMGRRLAGACLWTGGLRGNPSISVDPDSPRPAVFAPLCTLCTPASRLGEREFKIANCLLTGILLLPVWERDPRLAPLI